MMKCSIKRITLMLIALSAVVFIANIPTSIRVGIDGRYNMIRMPLYVKWIQFLSRHYEYERLSREITADCKTKEEKVLAILKWTKDNLRDVPTGMPVCDDHVLYIIIRGYAVQEQFQDVFVTLCTYAGMPAFFDKFYDKEHKVVYYLSFVNIDGRWSVFDAYYGKYFRKPSGEMLIVEDILKDPSLVKGEDIEHIMVNGAPYREFYHSLNPAYSLNIGQIKRGITLRTRSQMPGPRIVLEIKKALGIEDMLNKEP